MKAVLLASLAGFLFGWMLLAIHWGLRRQPGATAGAFGLVTVAFAVSLVAFAAFGRHVSGLTFANVWPLVASGALVPGVSHVIFVRAVGEAGPSRAGIVIATSPLISVVLSVVLLGEPFQLLAAVGAVLIVAGGAALAWERVRPAGFRIAGIWLAGCVALMFAVRDNLVRLSAHGGHLSPLPATVITLATASATVTLCVVAARRGWPGRGELRRSCAAFLPAGAFFACAYMALVAAFDSGRVAVVSPLNATQSLWAIALSALLLGRVEAIGARVALSGLLVVAGAATIGVTR